MLEINKQYLASAFSSVLEFDQLPRYGENILRHLIYR